MPTLYSAITQSDPVRPLVVPQHDLFVKELDLVRVAWDCGQVATATAAVGAGVVRRQWLRHEHVAVAALARVPFRAVRCNDVITASECILSWRWRYFILLQNQLQIYQSSQWALQVFRCQ